MANFTAIDQHRREIYHFEWRKIYYFAENFETLIFDEKTILEPKIGLLIIVPDLHHLKVAF